MSARALRFGLPALWIGTTVVAFGTAWTRLPDPMASHFGLDGRPDGAMPRALIGLVHLGLAVFAGIALGAGLRRSPGEPVEPRSGLSSATVCLGTLVTALGVCVVRANVDAAHWKEARPLGWATVLLVVLVPVVVGALVTWLRRGAGDTSSEAVRPAHSVGLGTDERAVWIGSAKSRVFAAAGVVALAAAAFGWAALPGGVFIAAALVAPVCLAFACIAVRIDDRGLEIAYGPFGWPRQRVPLSRLIKARAIDVRPMQGGGWGYRGSLLVFGRAAVILRSGDALELTLRGGKHLVVTVDDAANGAGLVNDLVARAAAPVPV